MSNHSKYQHCSLIYSGPRLITYGYNTKDYHAEIVAIRRLYAWMRVNNHKPKNLHIVNFMIRRMTNSTGNSYPCTDCYNAIAEAGIRRITWSSPNGDILQGDMSFE